MYWLLGVVTLIAVDVLFLMVWSAFWLRERRCQRQYEQEKMAHEDKFRRDQLHLEWVFADAAATEEREQQHSHAAFRELSEQIRYADEQLQLPEANIDVHAVAQIIDRAQRELPALLESVDSQASYQYRRLTENALNRAIEEFTARMQS